MHRREHVVVIRPGATGIVPKFESVAGAPFEAAKYRDGYREKLDALIAAKLEGKALTETAAPRVAPVVNILDALQRSLDSMARKSVVSDRAAARSKKKISPGK